MARIATRGLLGHLSPKRRLGWLWVVLTIATMANGARLRKRLAALPRLPAGGPSPPGEHVGSDPYILIVGPRVHVDAGTRAAAAAFATAQNLDVVDLVPGDLSLDAAVDLARAVDAATYRAKPLAPGRSSLHAMLVHPEVARRVDIEASTLDRVSLAGMAERLKLHAARTTDLVVAPTLRAVTIDTEERTGTFKLRYGPAFPAVLAARAILYGALAAGALVSPGWGGAALLAFCAEPYVATIGTPLRPADRWEWSALFRIIREPAELLRMVVLASRHRGYVDDPVEARRPAYSAELAQGTGRFLEPRRDSCPWCGGLILRERLRTRDLAQFKPGEFALDECVECGDVFQNPRLTPDGLDFYYRDFYDGLGQGSMEFLFGHDPSYRGRAELVRRHITPKSWLDVGAGHGHFCLMARDVFPDTSFDGLDMSESIEEAERRRWVDHGYRGFFPDLTGELAGKYDLVSMFHYLEHTRDPRAELDAACDVLPPGSHLLVEVPDPEAIFARLAGKWWIPWLQPQHQQLLPVSNLTTALEERGFMVVEVERVGHQLQVFGPLLAMARSLAPPPRLPWLDPPSPARRARRVVTLALAAPVLAAVLPIDLAVLSPAVGRMSGGTTAYRVLARRH